MPITATCFGNDFFFSSLSKFKKKSVQYWTRQNRHCPTYGINKMEIRLLKWQLKIKEEQILKIGPKTGFASFWRFDKSMYLKTREVICRNSNFYFYDDPRDLSWSIKVWNNWEYKKNQTCIFMPNIQFATLNSKTDAEFAKIRIKLFPFGWHVYLLILPTSPQFGASLRSKCHYKRPFNTFKDIWGSEMAIWRKLLS